MARSLSRPLLDARGLDDSVTIRTAPSALTLPPVVTVPPVTTVPPSALCAALPHVRIAGCVVHLARRDEALRIIDTAARRPHPLPLAVASVNLDHVHHFARSHGERTARPPAVTWLNLIDGAPIAHQAERLTGTAVPRLAGSDLIGAVFDDAELSGAVVAVVGGAPDLDLPLRRRMQRSWPGLRWAGQFSPTRAELDDPVAAAALAADLRAAHVDIVVVCLGKPRQEQWIEAHAAATGAGVLLAFGAVVDFLAGRVARAPRWVAAAGLEWLWRLVREPRRLARRYLWQGPPAYLAVRRSPHGESAL